MQRKNIKYLEKTIPTVKTAEIRQKKRHNQGIGWPKLSDVIPVSSEKVSEFKNNKSFPTIAEIFIKQELQV